MKKRTYGRGDRSATLALSAVLIVFALPAGARAASDGSQPVLAHSAQSRRLSAKRNQTLLVKADGSLWAWGQNDAGQLGDGTTINRTQPVQVPGLAGVAGVSAGWFHTLANLNDGTVRSWGLNTFGQLGDNTTTQRLTPVTVNINGVVAVAAGQYHSLALKNDGTVWAWGVNGQGRLGDGTATDRHTPVQVIGLTNVIAIAAGKSHSLALKGDGTVWAWGDNTHGQLGDNTVTIRTTAVQVVGLTGAVDIAAGGDRSMALKADGTVWGWGYDLQGQLGDGGGPDKKTPVQASGLTGVASIAAGEDHSLAVKADGTVWAWGFNFDGEVGNGTTTDQTVPVQVTGLSGVSVAGGGAAHSVALKQNQTVSTWGGNAFGQLGIGTTSPDPTTTPVTVPAFTGVSAAPDDFNSDGHPDLIWQSDATRQVTVHYYGGTGGAVFQGWSFLNSAGAPGWHVAGAADFDHNGVADLVWVNDVTRQVTVHYYGGAGGASFIGWNYLNVAGAPGWDIVAIADFNSDGNPDLVWQSDTTRQVTVHYYGGAGGAAFIGWNYLNVPGVPGWHVAGAADFNGNGVPDLVWQDDTSRAVTVHYYGGTGGAVFQGWSYLNVGAPGWHVVAAVDFNRDGVADLVWESDTSRIITVHYYGGAGGAAFTGWNYLNAPGVTGWSVVN